MLEHIADDVRQILLGDDFLLVAEFGDTLGDAASLLGGQFKTKFLEVLGDIGLAAVLAESILATASETLGHEGILVEAVLLVAVGMDACHLGEHVVADDGLVGGHGDAAVTLHETRDVVEFVLDDIRLRMELVLEDHLHARQRGVAATLTETVDRDVKSLGTTQGCG